MPVLKRLAVAMLCLGLAAGLAWFGVGLYYRSAYPAKYQDDVLRYSKEYGLDPSLTFAVIYTESRFRPAAVSSIGARGLMQITNDTFEWAKWRMKDDSTTYEDLFEPAVNIKYGTFILSLLKEEFKSDEVALAAYHAGWGNVKKWLSDLSYSSDGENIDTIPFRDTAWYVPQVQKVQKIYRRTYKLE